MFGLGTLSRVAGEVRRDVRAARDRDPAARGVGPAEILATWPGVQALLAHRVAHALHAGGVPFVPRAVATGVRALICVIPVPSLIVDVCAPTHASGVKTSEP